MLKILTTLSLGILFTGCGDKEDQDTASDVEEEVEDTSAEGEEEVEDTSAEAEEETEEETEGEGE